MIQENGKIKIRFELTNEFNENFATETNCNVWYDVGDTTLGTIFQYFNSFLNYCGFHRENDYILEDSLTGEEYDLLSEYLLEIRNKDNKELGGGKHEKN